jgi:hypothetical protein
MGRSAMALFGRDVDRPAGLALVRASSANHYITDPLERIVAFSYKCVAVAESRATRKQAVCRRPTALSTLNALMHANQSLGVNATGGDRSQLFVANLSEKRGQEVHIHR